MRLFTLHGVRADWSSVQFTCCEQASTGSAQPQLRHTMHGGICRVHNKCIIHLLQARTRRGNARSPDNGRKSSTLCVHCKLTNTHDQGRPQFPSVSMNQTFPISSPFLPILISLAVRPSLPWPTQVSVVRILSCMNVCRSRRLTFSGHIARSAIDEDHHSAVAAAIRKPQSVFFL